MSKADENRIHNILNSFAPRIVDAVAETGYFEMSDEGEINEIPSSFWRGITKASITKNEAVWDVAYRAFSSPALDRGIARVAKDLNLGTAPLTWHSQTTRQYFEDRSLQFVKDLSTTDKIRLRGYLFSHFGDHEKAFAKFVSERSYICDGNLARLRMIKRTETHTATEGGSFRYAYNAGARFKQWWTVGDNRVRESHRRLHGEIRAIDDPFDNGLLLPGEVNCRCWVAYFWDTPKSMQGQMDELLRLQEIYKYEEVSGEVAGGAITIQVELGE